MKTKNVIYLFLALVILWGCQDLEDTYNDMAGNGVIRYVGARTDISISPGWKRLYLKWKNSPDPYVTQIKITWTLDDVRDSVLIPADRTSYTIENLENGNYEIQVRGVDEDGNESLATPFFAKPYTRDHEVILSFTRLISRAYFLKDSRDPSKEHLALFFSSWSEDVESAVLTYTAGGVKKELKLTSELVGQKYYLHDEPVDAGTPVTLDRTGRVEGCEDLITFDTYTYAREKVFSSEFKQWMKMKYGQSDISNEFADNLEELEIDYSLSSLEDVLNLPHLKKLILGKNRYLSGKYLGTYKENSQLYDTEASLFALRAAARVYGLKVERYNEHFLPNRLFGGTLPGYITAKGNPEVPEIVGLDSKDWKVTCLPEDEGNYNSYVENLFDGNTASCWQPESQSLVRTHEIKVDMKKVQAVHGVKIMQKDFDPKSDKNSPNLLPGVIKIKVSADEKEYTDAIYVEENTIGATSGEVTILNFPEVKDIRYIKFIINDQPLGKNFTVTLAELVIF